MNGLVNGDYCWCCERRLMPSIKERKRLAGNLKIVSAVQSGPRYCLGCIRNGRKIKQRGPHA